MRVTFNKFQVGQTVICDGVECVLASPPTDDQHAAILVEVNNSLKETSLWALNQENPPVHFFDSTAEAYRAFLSDPSVDFGDVVVIPSERVVGVSGYGMFAISSNCGALRTMEEALKTHGDISQLLGKSMIAARHQERMLIN